MPQAQQVRRECVAGPVRRPVRPDPVDQVVRRDGTVHVDQQRHEDAPLPGMTHVDSATVESSLEVAK
jgi:hypothetical protein